jgi:hypothetical protein
MSAYIAPDITRTGLELARDMMDLLRGDPHNASRFSFVLGATCPCLANPAPF